MGQYEFICQGSKSYEMRVFCGTFWVQMVKIYCNVDDSVGNDDDDDNYSDDCINANDDDNDNDIIDCDNDIDDNDNSNESRNYNDDNNNDYKQ